MIKFPQTISGIKIPLNKITAPEQEIPLLYELAAHKLRISPSAIPNLTICKKSLDARDQEHPLFLYSVLVGGREQSTFCWRRVQAGSNRPLIAGAGPAGLFAAFALAQAGLKPLIIEKGKAIPERTRDVEQFWQSGCLNTDSNIQFGQGGAGAFSDGKLTSRSKDPLGREILRLLIACGADPSIAYWHKPHLGSDQLPQIIAALGRKICQLGGEFCYNTTLTDIGIRQGKLNQVTLVQDGISRELSADTLILAIGNGARSTYEMLARHQLSMEAKPFAIGLRIEHRQEMINQAQYHSFANHPLLPAAEYQLTFQDELSRRGVYSFCMCPGGRIVNAASEIGGVVTNGASSAQRNSGLANSALVVAVSPGRDFVNEPLAGMFWQQSLERKAFAVSNSYALPASTVTDFLNCTPPQGLPADFAPLGCGVVAADLWQLLPEEIAATLSRAIGQWQKQIPGFAGEAVLAGIETRTSAPLRLLRGENRQSLNGAGVYPAGEGAGYAGGIISSAIDGLRTAQAIIERMES